MDEDGEKQLFTQDKQKYNTYEKRCLMPASDFLLFKEPFGSFAIVIYLRLLGY